MGRPKLYVLSGDNEKPKAQDRCEVLKINARESKKFTAIQDEVADDLLRTPVNDVTLLGENNVAVKAYKALSGKITLEEYFKYLVSLIDRPRDIWKIINKPLLTYVKDSDDKDILRAPEEVLAKGCGDCDNISWLAKTLLDSLGCKNGHDYEARVIAWGNHAVCLFKDEDGKKYVMDQGQLITAFEKTPLFTVKNNDHPEEIILHPKKHSKWIYSLDDKTLEKNGEYMTILVYEDLQGDNFDMEKYIPEDWKSVKQTNFVFINGITVIYQGGRKIGKIAPNRVQTIYYENSLLVHRKQYPKGGKIELEVFERNGKLKQRTYSNGNVEFYYEDGKTVQQIHYGKKDTFTPFEMKFFDQNGKLTHVKLWGGEIRSV